MNAPDNQIPTEGYILEKWSMTHQYRSTAIAYMERENVDIVTNKNGNTYTLFQLQNAIIK